MYVQHVHHMCMCMDMYVPELTYLLPRRIPSPRNPVSGALRRVTHARVDLHLRLAQARAALARPFTYC